MSGEATPRDIGVENSSCGSAGGPLSDCPLLRLGVSVTRAVKAVQLDSRLRVFISPFLLPVRLFIRQSAASLRERAPRGSRRRWRHRTAGAKQCHPPKSCFEPHPDKAPLDEPYEDCPIRGIPARHPLPVPSADVRNEWPPERAQSHVPPGLHSLLRIAPRRHRTDRSIPGIRRSLPRRPL